MSYIYSLSKKIVGYITQDDDFPKTVKKVYIHMEKTGAGIMALSLVGKLTTLEMQSYYY